MNKIVESLRNIRDDLRSMEFHLFWMIYAVGVITGMALAIILIELSEILK